MASFVAILDSSEESVTKSHRATAVSLLEKCCTFLRWQDPSKPCYAAAALKGQTDPGFTAIKDVSETSEDTESTASDISVYRTPVQRLFGLSLILCASLLFSSSCIAAKFLKEIPSGQFVIVRGVYAVVLILPLSFHSGISLLSFAKPRLVFLRCFTHGSAYCLKIWCIKNMKIGDATAIYFTGIIFAGIFARIFLKEKYTVINIVSTILGLSGVILIAKPSFIFPSPKIASYPASRCLAALCAASLAGIAYTSQRGIGTAVHPIICTFYQNCVVIAGGVLLNFVTSTQYILFDCFQERLLLSACGIGACAAMTLLNKGLSIEKSAPATLMRNMDIVLAFVVQVFLFNEDVEWRSVLGAVLIVASAVSVTLERALCPNLFWQV